MLEFPEMEREVMPGFRPLPVKQNGVGEWPGCELKKCCKAYKKKGKHCKKCPKI